MLSSEYRNFDVCENVKELSLNVLFYIYNTHDIDCRCKYCVEYDRMRKIRIHVVESSKLKEFNPSYFDESERYCVVLYHNISCDIQRHCIFVDNEITALNIQEYLRKNSEIKWEKLTSTHPLEEGDVVGEFWIENDENGWRSVELEYCGEYDESYMDHKGLYMNIRNRDCAGVELGL